MCLCVFLHVDFQADEMTSTDSEILFIFLPFLQQFIHF